MFLSLCIVIIIGVNKVDKGIGDKGIFEKYRIANMIRQWILAFDCRDKMLIVIIAVN